MRTVAPSGSQLPSAFEFQFSGADDLRSIQPDLARPDNLRVRIRVASEILYEIDFRDGEKTVLTVSGVESKLYESGTFIAAISVSIPRYPDKFGRQTEEASGKIELSLMISDFHPSYLPPDELNGSGTARLFVRGLKWGIVTYTDLDRTISLDR